jgi:polyhydroxybutyrate depolymerase
MIHRSLSQPGDNNGTILYDGRRRTYLFHLPPSYDGTKATPLVFVFHGGGGTGQEAAEMTGFSQLSDQKGFLVVYPDGVDQHWSDGRGTSPPDQQGVDDVGFVSALLQDLSQSLKINRRRVYATGMSNGAIFTQRLGCELTAKIAAIGPVAGTMAENIALTCAPRLVISVVEFHGTDDLVVPFKGGEVQGECGGTVLSVAETVERWVNLNRCPTSPKIRLEPDKDPNDGTRVLREVYRPCQNGAGVVLYIMKGGGHTWPDGPGGQLPTSGRVSRDINATEVIWDFFAKHPKKITFSLPGLIAGGVGLCLVALLIYRLQSKTE